MIYNQSDERLKKKYVLALLYLLFTEKIKSSVNQKKHEYQQKSFINFHSLVLQKTGNIF